MIRKYLFASALLVASASIATAANPPIYVGFESPDYTAGDLVGQGGWTSSLVGATPIQVSATGLSYAGYSTAGGSLTMGDAGQDEGLSFDSTITPGTGNTYYYSMMIQHDGTDVGNTFGDYFAHFTGGTADAGTAFRGRLLLAQGSTAGVAKIGIRFGSNDANVYGTTDIPANTTAFVVVKVTEVAGADNDEVDAYLFLAPAAIPGTEPGTTEASTANDGTNTAGQDIGEAVGNNIGRFGLRQGNAASGAKFSLDELRIGTTWADILPAAGSSVDEWMMY